MPYPTFDRSRLVLRPLKQREHDMTLDDVLPLDAEVAEVEDPRLDTLAERILAAREKDRPVILMMGAHVIKAGLSRFVIDLLEGGLVTCVGMNGAGPIHDYELSLVGATTESVARYIQTGEFGLWEETGRLNEIAKRAADDSIGLGEAVGRAIVQGNLPHRDVSICGTAYRLNVPVTVHLGVGYDITHEHPNCDGAALGAATYTDFLVFAHVVSQLEGGVFLNFGSAVMGPEVYLKALSMARNVARQEGREIRRFTTAVFDLIELGDIAQEAPKSDHRYYYRPYKTILVRTVADGGESFYFQMDHRVSMINLCRRLS